MLPSLGIEAIAGLIPIQLHLQKLSRRIQLWTHSLLPNYIINSILEVRYSSNKEHHLLLMENLTTKQKLKIKEPIIDANNRLNGIFKLFDLFNLEFFSGNRLVDLFSNHISFSYSDRRSIDFRKSHIRKLDEVVFNALTDPNSAIIVLDASIKNNIVTLIAHIHTHNSPIIKTIHHTTNVISTEAKLFAIRCGISQVVQLFNIKWIIVITDSIHAVEKFFNSSVHSYQTQTASISKKVRHFFKRNNCNSLEF